MCIQKTSVHLSLITEISDISYTGWQSISEIKYCLTVTSFWVLVTFWAYRRLTRCGPFDKIALWSLLMPIWDHLSLVSKETIFRRCTNFSDFWNYWKTFSDDNSPKKDQRVIHEPFFDWQFRRKDSIILKIHSVIQFFGNYHQKMFLKCCKNHWN